MKIFKGKLAFIIIMIAMAISVISCTHHVKSPEEYILDEVITTEEETTTSMSSSTTTGSSEIRAYENTTTVEQTSRKTTESETVTSESTTSEATTVTTTVTETTVTSTEKAKVEPVTTTSTTMIIVAAESTLFSTTEVYIDTSDNMNPIVNEDNAEVVEQPFYQNVILYVVQSNDSLYKISTQFGIGIEDIMSVNGMDTYYIYPGQTLLIPQTYDTGYQTDDYSNSDYNNELYKVNDGMVWDSYVSLYTSGANNESWQNIQLSSQILNAGGWWNYSTGNYTDGFALGPGESFSWFGVLGPCDGSQGFCSAPSYAVDENGITIPSTSVGGGICFTSTSLMQAARSAGCIITEKHDHTAPVSYASPSDEASVSYDPQGVTWDMQFYNPSSTTTLIFHMDTSIYGCCSVWVTTE